jgi:hypothetical protein
VRVRITSSADYDLVGEVLEVVEGRTQKPSPRLPVVAR